MCGRYSLALRPAQVRHMLQGHDMPVNEAPEDEGEGAPRQSYNFAPGYCGIVYRADVPDWGAGPHWQAKKAVDSGQAEEEVGEALSPSQDGESSQAVHYKLQSMKWGLVPFWTKRSPDYSSMMKTINCRADSLAQSGGMWNIMKARKRCIVIAQGFFEWLKKDGGRTKMPHYVKRKDGALMCFAGLWDCVQYENENKHYTYTIITTDSNKQLGFLHDRMPVILDNGSGELRTWLDPQRHEWTSELQSLLKPFQGELDVYPVSRDVGKVGNNSPNFIVPLDQTKSSIVNFFAKGVTKEGQAGATVKQEQPEMRIEGNGEFVEDAYDRAQKFGPSEIHPISGKSGGLKREAGDGAPGPEPPKKMARPPTSQKGGRQKISATKNHTRSPEKPKQPSTRKITQFLATVRERQSWNIVTLNSSIDARSPQ